eukprot:2654383-Rhodomonas_salina.2
MLARSRSVSATSWFPLFDFGGCHVTVPGTGRCGAATGWLSPYAFAEQSPILSCGMPQGSLVLSYDMLYWVREVLSDVCRYQIDSFITAISSSSDVPQVNGKQAHRSPVSYSPTDLIPIITRPTAYLPMQNCLSPYGPTVPSLVMTYAMLLPGCIAVFR